MNTIDYDVVVIGSGAGGMAAAVALAQAGKKVLVCEQHEVAGGYCQSFTLEGYCFSPGVHYVGGIQPGGSLRIVYEGLGVSGDLEFCELNPDGFDHVIVGEERFDIPKDVGIYIDRLIHRFPHEKEGIVGYFKKVIEIVSASLSSMSPEPLPDRYQAWRNRMILARWSFSTVKNLIDLHVSDPLLKAVLGCICGCSGLPPSRMSAIVHALVLDDYFNGGYYPRGGAFTIPRAFTRALRRAGGELRRNTHVDAIMLEDIRAIGVRLEDGEEIRADYVVSNADPEVTFGKLIGRQRLSRKLRRRLDRTIYSTSNLSLFMAVDMDLRAAGMDSGVYWLCEHADLDLIYTQGLSDYIISAESPPMIFFGAPTLKDPSMMNRGHHTLEALALTSYQPFAQWADQKSGQRDSEYQELKDQLRDKILTGLEKQLPGLRESLIFCELATPLTNQHYVNATQGHMYGTAKIRSQVGPFTYPAETEFKGLYCCGASTLNHGVSGSTWSGLDAAGKIMNCHMSDFLHKKGPELRIYPSEKPEEWPQHLQKRIARGQCKEFA